MTPREPGRVRLYLVARQLWTRALRASQAVFDGVWLGLLDRSSLHRIDELCHSRWEAYRTDSYNRSGLRAWERGVIDDYFPHGSRIVLVGAGGGREVLALSELGYRVDAYECHPELVRAASRLLNASSEGTQVRILERDQAPSNADPCDAAVIGWGAYMHVRGRQRRVSMLTGLREKLPAGAPILLSFYDRSPTQRRFRLSAAVANVLRILIANDRVEVGDGLAPNFVHYFTEDEIREELHAGGFELVHFSSEEYGHAVGRAR